MAALQMYFVKKIDEKFARQLNDLQENIAKHLKNHCFVQPEQKPESNNNLVTAAKG